MTDSCNGYTLMYAIDNYSMIETQGPWGPNAHKRYRDAALVSNAR